MSIFRIRKRSAFDDFKTGIASKFLLFLGVIFVVIYIIFKGISTFMTQEENGFLRLIYNFAHSNYLDPIFAFSIISIGTGLILYFIHLQFVKLADIARELEEEKIEKR